MRTRTRGLPISLGTPSTYERGKMAKKTIIIDELRETLLFCVVGHSENPCNRSFFQNVNVIAKKSKFKDGLNQ